MTESSFDLIVVGGGVFGLSTALEAGRRRRRTLVVDRRVVPNPMAASFGPSRKIRSTYLDAHYTRLALEAMAGWRRIEAEARRELYVAVGNLNVREGGRPACHGAGGEHRIDGRRSRGAPRRLDVPRATDRGRRRRLVEAASSRAGARPLAVPAGHHVSGRRARVVLPARLRALLGRRHGLLWLPRRARASGSQGGPASRHRPHRRSRLRPPDDPSRLCRG